MIYVTINGRRQTRDPYADGISNELTDRMASVEFDRCARDGTLDTWDRETFMTTLEVVGDGETRIMRKGQFIIEWLYGITACAAEHLLYFPGAAP